MEYYEVIKNIRKLCGDESLGFDSKGQKIEQFVNRLTKNKLLEHLDSAGIIPEEFEHDSTEEKLFAKYCDALLAKAFAELGLKTKLITDRSDAADLEVFGHNYRIVADSKAFRLSRTAKNQKDFKVEALNQWKKGADYACLVGPLYQYPNRSSQIYSQAKRYNVTLLSYTHVGYLIKFGIKSKTLRELWEVPGKLKSTNDARGYWKAINNKIIELTNTTVEKWEESVEREYSLLAIKGREQIMFWENEKKRILSLPHKQAVIELIRALKIDSKISEITKAVGLS